MYYILIDDPKNSTHIANAIDDEFHNATAQTKTESEQAFTVGFLAFLGNVKVFLVAICAAVMFTILLVSANTMAMSVRERRREVGVLKTLGFTPGAVLGIILGEACAISLAGGLLGLRHLGVSDDRNCQEPLRRIPAIIPRFSNLRWPRPASQSPRLSAC